MVNAIIPSAMDTHGGSASGAACCVSEVLSGFAAVLGVVPNARLNARLKTEQEGKMGVIVSGSDLFTARRASDMRRLEKEWREWTLLRLRLRTVCSGRFRAVPPRAEISVRREWPNIRND